MSLGSTFVLCCVLVACVAQEKRAMGFVGMRGKKDPGAGSNDLDEAKRAPMGFQGVRGKKDYFGGDATLTDDINDFNEFKRAMGFQGMRGKKAMGFMGMRGKKDMDYSWVDEDKRGAPAGFFGMRGKKGPMSSSFFGMRGKKGPSSAFFGVRGKKGPRGFLGVRGKKDGSDIDSLLQLLKESAVRQEMEDMVDARARRYVPLGDAFEDYQMPSDGDIV